jgi:hypothetical protein
LHARIPTEIDPRYVAIKQNPYLDLLFPNSRDQFKSAACRGSNGCSAGWRSTADGDQRTHADPCKLSSSTGIEPVSNTGSSFDRFMLLRQYVMGAQCLRIAVAELP